MPYLTCPGCRSSLYSAASHSWIDGSCPVCSTPLEPASTHFRRQTGTHTLRRRHRSTSGAAARPLHALDGLRAERGKQLHTTTGLLVSNSAVLQLGREAPPAAGRDT